MTRRTLFALLAAAAADPERLIWQPGRKLISIPAPPPVPVYVIHATTPELGHWMLVATVYRTTDGHQCIVERRPSPFGNYEQLILAAQARRTPDTVIEQSFYPRLHRDFAGYSLYPGKMHLYGHYREMILHASAQLTPLLDS